MDPLRARNRRRGGESGGRGGARVLARSDRHRELGPRRHARRRGRRPDRADPVPQCRRAGVHRVAWAGGGARRVVPLVLVDARRCVRDRRRRIDAQPLPREQGHLRTGRLRRRTAARHVHVRRGLPLVGLPAHRRRDGCRGSLVAAAQRAPRSPSRGRNRARLEDRYRRGARRHDRGADARSRRLDAAARDQHGDRDRLSVARRRHRVRGTTVTRPDGPRRLRGVGGRSIRHVVRLAVPPRRHRRRAHRDSRRSARRAARLADAGRQSGGPHVRFLGPDQRDGPRQLGPDGRVRRHPPVAADAVRCRDRCPAPSGPVRPGRRVRVDGS